MQFTVFFNQFLSKFIEALCRFTILITVFLKLLPSQCSLLKLATSKTILYCARLACSVPDIVEPASSWRWCKSNKCMWHKCGRYAIMPQHRHYSCPGTRRYQGKRMLHVIRNVKGQILAFRTCAIWTCFLPLFGRSFIFGFVLSWWIRATRWPWAGVVGTGPAVYSPSGCNKSAHPCTRSLTGRKLFISFGPRFMLPSFNFDRPAARHGRSKGRRRCPVRCPLEL